MAEANPPKFSKRPPDTPFRQQRLASWQPVLTPTRIIAIFIVIGIIFIPVGTTLLDAANDVYEQTVIYDGTDVDSSTDCAITEQNQGKPCQVNFTLTDDVTGPVYVYYLLQNYYQNHRRYVKSRSALQLQGDTMSESDVSLDCDPLVKNGTTLLNPCGLVANSYFTDIIGYSPAAGGAEMDESGIAWETDKSRFSQVSGFKYVENNNLTTPFPLTESYCNSVLQVSSGAEYYPYDGYPNPVTYESYCFYYPDNDNVQYLYEGYPDQISPIEGVTNEHFMVWMRTAGLPTFRKLYGKIDGDFSKGDVLTFDLIANFEVDSFDASKGLVISTLGDLGGKNPFIGVAYVVVGAISLVLAALFGLKYFLDPRKQGSSEFLHWE